ncbi:MAG: 3-dehydroquinate dehydratase [Ignavibacteriaceae bacterium]|nr:3-dehydroquinate dehydratase [Ignavibacteriaceae bacterium]
MKILVINGPNLNMLGMREQSNYGSLTLSEIINAIRTEFKEINFEFYQSNIEGEIVGKIQNAQKEFDALIINPGGYSHTSVAIKDALEICKIIKIEVHLSHLVKREDYRQILLTAGSCDGYIAGFKEKGYLAAVYLVQKLNNRK